MIWEERCTAPPARLPLSLAEFKAHARIDDDTPNEDALIQAYIAAATSVTESHCGRCWLTQEWEFTWHRWPNGPLILPRAPLQSITSLTWHRAGNPVAMGVGTYHMRGERDHPEIWPGDGPYQWNSLWPADAQGGKVTLRAVLGYGDHLTGEEEMVKLAIAQLAVRFYDARGENAEDDSNPHHPLPRHVRMLLMPFWKPRA